MDAVVFEAGWTNTAEAMREALKIYTKDARKDKFTAKVALGVGMMIDEQGQGKSQ